MKKYPKEIENSSDKKVPMASMGTRGTLIV